MDVAAAVDPPVTIGRKPWLAALLSLLLPGLGQMYNGQLKKGVWFYVTSGLVGLLALLVILNWPLRVVAGLFLLQLVLKFWSIADAVFSARRLREHFRPSTYNQPLAYLGVFLIFGLQAGIFTSTAIRQRVVQAYAVPTPSMEPSLLPGDHVLVDMSAAVFARGDIVVFVVPTDEGKSAPRDFIKRIVGLPGDEIEIRDKQLYVNGNPLQERYIIHAEGAMMPAETGPRDRFGPARVPEGALFVLGDNRDRSFDSRFWGWVSAAKVHGKAARIYWSKDPVSRKVRWDRIGLELL